jgi:ariadne-1
MDDEEDYYMSADDGELSQGSAADYEDDDDAFADDTACLNAAEHVVVPRAAYQCFGAVEVRAKQSEAIARVVAVLQVNTDEATQLLRTFKWNVNTVNEEWFADEERVRTSAGLLPRDADASEPEPERVVRCGVCFEDFSADASTNPGCRHDFCGECWRGYLENAVDNGPSCLDARCPHEGCGARVTEALARRFLSDAAAEKLSTFQWRSWVDDNPRVKWCVGPGCERSVQIDVVRGERPVDVTSHCGTSFCWQCQEQAHRPVDCETVRKWLIKNSAESENMNWILANTKPCPECKRPIEKSMGCMHMTCSQCQYQFCWMCQGKWADHGERTGGFYACNTYEKEKKYTKNFSEDEKRRALAKSSLERYMHYYERWLAHGSSQVKAVNDLKEMTESKIARLGDLQNTPASQLKFVMDALEQIAECRRVLKWTYGYGFYNMEDDGMKKKFFEYIQADAEVGLERLTKAVETDLEEFFHEEKTAEEFDTFRGVLTGLTSVTAKYFKTLVTELEEGLPGVESEAVDAAGGGKKPGVLTRLAAAGGGAGK